MADQAEPWVSVIHLHIPATPADQVEHVLRLVLEHTRAFEGSLGVQLWNAGGDFSSWVLIERWVSQEAHRSYVEWRRGDGRAKEMDELVASGMTTHPAELAFSI